MAREFHATATDRPATGEQHLSIDLERVINLDADTMVC